jgi:cytochrome c oxidase assembly protein subunit 15
MSTDRSAAQPGLALYAKVVVVAVFVLIFLGGLVTSWQAGMAVPDWPLSFGSLNPSGWWENFPVRLEHGHRLFASVVGLLTTILCAWVWRNGWPLLWAAVASVVLTMGAQLIHLPPIGVMHTSIWSFAGTFAALLLITSKPVDDDTRAVRWTAFWAFIAVCLQATLGGLRVTRETAGFLQLAFALRVFHGCVAQAFLCLVVATATLLSAHWQAPHPSPAPGRARRLAWMTFTFIYVQLIFGAVMRHLGAGLAIPTFPAAAPDGSWLPHVHNSFVDTNFAHTRIFAFLVALHVVLITLRVFRTARGEPRLVWPAATLLALLGVQLTLGVFVILHTKPPTLTTFHVLNGAALLAVSLLLALRLRRFGSAFAGSPSRFVPEPVSDRATA